MIGKSLILKTDFKLNPSVVSGFASLQKSQHTLLNTNKFGSTLYKSLAGVPKLSWFIPFDDVIDVTKFTHPMASAREALSADSFSEIRRTVGKTIDHVSSQVLVLHRDASHGEPSRPTYLYETRLAFTPGGAFALETGKLKEHFSKVCASHHKSNGFAHYAYSTLISPVFDWYIGFDNLADLDAALSDVHKELSEAGEKLGDFYSTVTSIETFLLKKIIEK